ncbi:F-box family protein [Rhynchospora pubera]|uniref:F-box family protein n=1 Tax=Rhynchospora pubera TaxID=906938 RepID=A0AAV8GN53_9POAL|nr:F-box family protein [Rhynchospora pubera]
MEASPSEFRDWAHLPPLVSSLISVKIKSIPDYFRFRAVCSSWRSASDPKPRHLPPQVPWLMIPYDPYKKNDDGIRLFYDCSESKTHKLHLPETINMICCGSFGGWLLLVMAAGEDMFLLNPLTRARIQLPSTATLEEHVRNDYSDIYFHEEGQQGYNPYLGDFAIRRVTFSTDLSDPNCLITIFLKGFQAILCCRVGDSGWTKVNTGWGDVDALYYNGRFHVLFQGTMDIFEPHEPEEKIQLYGMKKELLLCKSKYFLQGKSGVYIVAIQSIEDEEEETCLKYQDNLAVHKRKKATKKTHKKIIELYQFQEQQEVKFKKVTDTNNDNIFYGYDNEYKCHYLVVSDEGESLAEDCIHMEYKCSFFAKKNRSGSYCRIDSTKLDKQKVEFPAPPVVLNLGNVPLSWLRARPAMWFQPSFD